MPIERVELGAIVGEQLSAVTFVQDYVQLHFDGPMITAITLPVVVEADRRLQFDSLGYRDALCGQISRIVTSAYAIPRDRVQVDFPGSVSLIVSLKPGDYRTAEAAHFDDGSGAFWVW